MGEKGPITGSLDVPAGRLHGGRVAIDPTQSIVRFLDDSAECVLRVLSGDDVGRELLLSDTPSTVGRSSRADLQLTNSTVSDRHAVLRRVAGGVEVQDLESTNGTTYLGTRIQHAVIPLGATVEFGKCRVSLSRARASELEASTQEHYGEIWGASEPMRRLFAALERIERIDFPVLLLGETGVGKELFAHEIHKKSRRSKHPFVICDCASLALSVAESELFGHVRGAFTSAESERKGLFEQAHRGTIFLDELGELPPELQPKLLRVLEGGQIRPVGASGTRDVDVRVVAATNRDLSQEVRAGRFRQDLFFRLNPITLQIPPLRARPGDIPALVQRILERLGCGEVTLSEETLRLLGSTYEWPGNVRELRNALMHVQALGQLPESLASDLSEGGPAPLLPGDTSDGAFRDAKRQAVDAFERDYLASRLNQAGGNVSEAARLSGLDRSRFRRLLKKHGLHG